MVEASGGSGGELEASGVRRVVGAGVEWCEASGGQWRRVVGDGVEWPVLEASGGFWRRVVNAKAE